MHIAEMRRAVCQPQLRLLFWRCSIVVGMSAVASELSPSCIELLVERVNTLQSTANSGYERVPALRNGVSGGLHTAGRPRQHLY